MASKRKILANRQNWRLRGPLTEAGRKQLREAAFRNQPWANSTGPRTAQGKDRSRMNALKSGRHTAQMRAWRCNAMRFISLDHWLRDTILGRATLADPKAVACQLVELARELSAQEPSPPSA